MAEVLDKDVTIANMSEQCLRQIIREEVITALEMDKITRLEQIKRLIDNDTGLAEFFRKIRDGEPIT